VGHADGAAGRIERDWTAWGIERGGTGRGDGEKYCEEECNHGGEASLSVAVVKIDHMLRYLSTNDTGTPALSVITA
jgi:hypothetical protein